MLPDPHSTIQEEETEAKPTFAKQVTIILLITSCSFWPRMFFVPCLTDLRRSSRGDTSAALVSNEAVLIANARPAKVITKTKTMSTQTIYKGILHQKIFYRLNLIFWIVMGCGIAAHLGFRGTARWGLEGRRHGVWRGGALIKHFSDLSFHAVPRGPW